MDLMEMDVKRLEAAIEAILFTMGESVEAQDLAKAISQDVPCLLYTSPSPRD